MLLSIEDECYIPKLLSPSFNIVTQTGLTSKLLSYIQNMDVVNGVVHIFHTPERPFLQF